MDEITSGLLDQMRAKIVELEKSNLDMKNYMQDFIRNIQNLVVEMDNNNKLENGNFIDRVNANVREYIDSVKMDITETAKQARAYQDEALVAMRSQNVMNFLIYNCKPIITNENIEAAIDLQSGIEADIKRRYK